MEVSLVNFSLFIILLFSAINFFQAYEERIRTYPNLKGLDEGRNPFINFLNILIFIGIAIIEYKHLGWWKGILHFAVFYFLTPFLVHFIAKLFNERLLAQFSIILKFIVIIFSYLEIFGAIDLI